MKNKLLILVFICLTIPQLAFASWWNPFSWGQRTKVIESVQPNSQEVIPPVIDKPVVQEKVVETVIKVSDQELQRKIDALIQENIKLRADYLALKTQLENLAEVVKPSTKTVVAHIIPKTPPPVIETAIVPKLTFSKLFDDQAAFISNVPLDPTTLSIIIPNNWVTRYVSKTDPCYEPEIISTHECPDWSSTISVSIFGKSVLAIKTDNGYSYTIQLKGNISIIIPEALSTNHKRVFKISIAPSTGQPLVSKEVHIVSDFPSYITLAF